jgi:ABC-type branched-subunit amino acid transport system permease subunit
MLGCAFFLERLVRTPLGRMLRATRDNEDVAESLGKDVTRIRMKVIVWLLNVQNLTLTPLFSR